MHMVDPHVAGHRQFLGLGCADHLDRTRRGNAAHVQARAGSAHQQQQLAQRDRLGKCGNALQAQARGYFAVVRHAVPREREVLGAQPDREIEGPRVLQRAPEHLRVVQWHVGLRESEAPGFVQLGHLGQAFAGQFHRKCADRVEARLRQRLGAPAQHVHQPRFVQRRVGVGRAGQAGHPAGHCGMHLGFQRRLVLEARLAQPRADVHEARGDDEALRIDGIVGLRPAGGCVERHDALAFDQHVADGVPAACRVDDAPALDECLHQLPAMMLMTAIRTAMPKVTCGRITECGPSATAESISTPRFIGPGCITIASDLASESLSADRP
jgi:hypothetical protein